MENVRIATSDCVLIDFPGFITADLKSKFTLDEDENLTFTHKGTQMMASIQQTHNILIKLHKIRRSNGEVRYRFVGKLIRKTYRFNFLCDYHLSSNDPMNSIFHSAYHPSLEKLPIIRPPYFTMSRWGYEYLYKENPAIKHGTTF